MPEWLDNPAMVFKSDTYPNRLVFIAPENVGSNPIKIIVEPNGESLKAHVLLNAYDMHETAQHQDGRHKGNPFNTFMNWRDRDLPACKSFRASIAGASLTANRFEQDINRKQPARLPQKHGCRPKPA